MLLCAWRGRDMNRSTAACSRFISLLSCMLPLKAVLSVVALGLWTRITIGRHSLWGDAISHAQQSCLGSSQLLASPKATGLQCKCCWLPQEIWLGCWWHTQPDWAGAGIKYALNYSWHINFMLRIRYTFCTLKCLHSYAIPWVKRKIANRVILRLVSNENVSCDRDLRCICTTSSELAEQKEKLSL